MSTTNLKMDKEDLFKLAQCTSDDDSQAPEEVVKALLGVAAKGKPPAVKELSDWLINRLGETESARVKLKVLRLMMQIMASKKGAKFKAQLREDGGPILRATTNFETEIDPEHGEKPMLFVRKSAVKCLTLLELSTTAEPAASPAAGGTADGASLAERKKALAERKAALGSEQTAAAAPAPAPKPAARAPAVSAAPTVAPSVAAAPPATATPSGSATGGVAAGASADIDALVQARVDAAMAAIAPKIAAAVRVTERMDKLERNVEEKVAEVRREAQQAQERLAVAEVEWTERLEKAQAEAERASGFAELDQRLRDALDAAANTVAEGGEAGLATKWELKWEEIGSRVSAIEAAGMTAAAESRAKSESLAGLLLQLRKRANAAEEDTARITHSLEQLDSRLDSAREALMTEVQLVSSSAASASAASADSSALDAMQAQLAEVDRKFSEANQAQATWLEEQLTQAAVESSTAVRPQRRSFSRLMPHPRDTHDAGCPVWQVAAAEQTAQRAAIDAEGKVGHPLSVAEFWRLLWSVATNRERWAQALSAVTAAVEGFEDTMNVVEDRITFMEESMEAGIGDRCEGDPATQASVLFNLLTACAWRIGIESEVQSISSIVLAMKSGQVGFSRSADCHDFRKCTCR